MSFADRLAAAHARLQTIAVTGTNGKTTTTSMVASIVAAAGEPCARVTTVGAFVDDERITGADLTDEFLLTVERAVERGVRTIAIEMTSKALAGGIARTWRPDVGVVTNVTRDHLDLHGTPEAYLAAKAQIVIALAPGGTAVLNANDPHSALIAEVVPAGVAIAWFSQTGNVLAKNAAAATLACRALGYADDVIARGLATFPGVPGRFEIVARDPLVVVDYAHTPDGLETTLASARELGRRVICVFGCGGNRDRGKRPEMGAIADRDADIAILTTDNPRFEDPGAIANDILDGVPAPRAEWIVELDRERAIVRALELAQPADIVVIAGKGHEQIQEIAGAAIAFSDVETVRRYRSSSSQGA
ncbi:MAG: Mur ligase family protein [Kofleriaceae bacterium]